jgi:hypothetical protein
MPASASNTISSIAPPPPPLLLLLVAVAVLEAAVTVRVAELLAEPCALLQVSV